MGDLMLFIIITLIIIGMVVLIFILGNRGTQKKREDLIQFAQAAGWTAEPFNTADKTGLRFKGNLTKGGWTMEVAKAIAPSLTWLPGEYANSTRWWTSSLRLTKGAILIGPKTGMDSINDLYKSSRLRPTVLHMMLGEDTPWTSKLIPCGFDPMSGELAETYFGVKDESSDHSPFLKPQIKQALLAVPSRMRPAILLRKEGLELRLPNQALKKEEDLHAIVLLGATIVEYWEK